MGAIAKLVTKFGWPLIKKFYKQIMQFIGQGWTIDQIEKWLKTKNSWDMESYFPYWVSFSCSCIQDFRMTRSILSSLSVDGAETLPWHR